MKELILNDWKFISNLYESKYIYPIQNFKTIIIIQNGILFHLCFMLARKLILSLAFRE